MNKSEIMKTSISNEGFTNHATLRNSFFSCYAVALSADFSETSLIEVQCNQTYLASFHCIESQKSTVSDVLYAYAFSYSWSVHISLNNVSKLQAPKYICADSWFLIRGKCVTLVPFKDASAHDIYEKTWRCIHQLKDCHDVSKLERSK